ncbi:MAG: VanZ family protein [Prevotellaceae bacterium]|jgi:VanZ family protein|nr:VanZ family protein [Prevotellaceae bacterium]
MSFLKKYWKSLLAAATIFYLCTLRTPPVDIIPPFPHFDKVVHFGLFLILAFCLAWDNRRSLSSWRKFQRIRILVLLPAAYGAIIEILQGVFFPPRTADLWDFAADTAGALLVYFFFQRLKSSAIQA